MSRETERTPRAQDGGEPVKVALSDRDWDAFMDALDNPPEPGEKLKKLMRLAEPRKRRTPKTGGK